MMTACRVGDYRRVLAECFVSDQDLLCKWHISSGQGLEACVEKTFDDLFSACVDFFKITSGTNLVGYFARESCDGHQFLTGFFLKPEFRTEEAKKEFWRLVKTEIRGPFFCGLYTKNLPANKFIKNNGGLPIRVFTLPDGEAVFYQLGA